MPLLAPPNSLGEVFRVVGTEGDWQLAEARVREVPGDLRVENLIAVEPDGQRCPDDVSHRPTTGAHHGD